MIPETVTKFGDYAFDYCTSLSNILFSESLCDIGSSAFRNTAWYSNQADGVVYAGNIAYGIKGEMPESVVLKDGTLAIANYAFYLQSGDNNTILKNVHIPAGLKYIGSGAFNSCRHSQSYFYQKV
jgi:hypothetical protein